MKYNKSANEIKDSHAPKLPKQSPGEVRSGTKKIAHKPRTVAPKTGKPSTKNAPAAIPQKMAASITTAVAETAQAKPLKVRVGGMYQNRTEHRDIAITDLGVFLREPQPQDTVVAFDKESDQAVLDADVHHWPDKPTDEFLIATASTISPPPDHWYVSHGHGWKGIYSSPDARQRAAIAALSLPKDFRVELANEFRHPAARSSKHDCTAGPVQSNPTAQGEKTSFREVGTLRRGEVADYLSAQGMALNHRYSHEKCPIAGHEPSDAGDCVHTLDTGFYCYRCAGKGMHYKAIRKPGFVPYAMLVDGAATVIERLVDYRIHFEHAQHELVHEYPNLKPPILKEIYKAALIQHYGATDPRVRKIFNNDLRVLYTNAGWVDASTFMETSLDNDLIDHLPAALYLTEPNDDGDVKVAVDRVRRSNIKNRTPNGLTPIRPYRGIRLYHDANTVPVEAPPHLQFPVEILADPMPIDEAFGRLLTPFPGMHQPYLIGSITAMICAEMGGAQPPGVTATGPSGSGKGETINVGASFLGDTPVKVQLDENAEVFMRQMGTSTAAGYRALLFDEFGKLKGIQQKMANVFQVSSKITYRPLYGKGMRTVPFRSAMFFPCVRFPDFLRTSPEYLRRTRGVHLPSRVPNWMATSGGDAATWRHRSKENAHIGNSILTHAYRICFDSKFVFDGTSDCVANKLGLGSIGDGAEGIDPEHLRNLYRYAHGNLGEQVFFEKDLSFAKGWLDLNAPKAKSLITVFASGDDRDPNMWRRSVQMNLEAASWNDVLGFADPPVTIDIKVHGSRWGMRFRRSTACARGQEVLNEALPRIPDDAVAVPTAVPPAPDGLDQLVAAILPPEPAFPPPPPPPPAYPPPPPTHNPLAAAGFPI